MSNGREYDSAMECGFCQGRPVGNAAAWHTLGVPKYAPCPRCGVQHPDTEVPPMDARTRALENERNARAKRVANILDALAAAELVVIYDRDDEEVDADE